MTPSSIKHLAASQRSLLRTSSRFGSFFTSCVVGLLRALGRKCAVMYVGVAIAMNASAGTLLASEPRTTLFIDLNNAAAEIVAVRSALGEQRRGGQLIVVPSALRFPAARRAEILDSQARLSAAQTRALDCTKDDGANGCQQVWAEMRELELARLKMTGSYGIGELMADIQQQVIDSGIGIDMLVISGHHSGGYFGGEISRLDVMDLETLNSVFPTVFQNIRSVLLLGCETGSQQMVQNVFAPLFPSARVIIGSDGVAPLRDDPRNLRFVRAAMLAQPVLTEARSVGDASRAYRTLQRQPWPVALLWNREHYFARTSHSAAP